MNISLYLFTAFSILLVNILGLGHPQVFFSLNWLYLLPLFWNSLPQQLYSSTSPSKLSFSMNYLVQPSISHTTQSKWTFLYISVHLGNFSTLLLLCFTLSSSPHRNVNSKSWDGGLFCLFYSESTIKITGFKTKQYTFDWL